MTNKELLLEALTMSKNPMYNEIMVAQDPFSNLRLMLRLYNAALGELTEAINDESLQIINKETLEYKRKEIAGYVQQLNYIINKVGGIDG